MKTMRDAIEQGVQEGFEEALSDESITMVIHEALESAYAKGVDKTEAKYTQLLANLRYHAPQIAAMFRRMADNPRGQSERRLAEWAEIIEAFQNDEELA